MAIRNTPSITPLRRPKPPPPPPSVDGSDRAKLRQAQEAQKRAQTPSYTPWTGGGNASFVAPPGAAPFVEYGVDRSGDRMGGNLSFGRGTPAEEAPAQTRGPLNWRDAAYNAQIASIQRALADFETDSTTRGERYGQDFTTGLQRLGYRPAEGFQAMPNVLEQLNQAQARTLSGGAQGGAPAVALPAVSGMFDIEGEFDPYSAAARGTRSTRDEFAGRGTLRSSDFAKTFGDFQNRLNQQLEAMETSRTRFGQDLATDVARERTRSQERQQQAQRDAMMRAATAAASGGGF